MLLTYRYPGNIRELKSILQSAVNLAQGGVITRRMFPSPLREVTPAVPNRKNGENGAIIPLPEVEKAHILKVYRQLNQNKSRTCRLLGIGMNTLRRKRRAYGVV